MKSKLSVGLLLFAVMALSINLRSPIMAVGPVVNFIHNDLAVSGAFMGVVAALPLLAFGVFSPFVVKLAKRFGIANTLVGSILLIIVGIILRSCVPSTTLLIIGTLLLSVAIAIGNVLLPALAKQELPEHVGLTIGVLTASMALSCAFVSAVAVPIAEKFNWQRALDVWLIFALLALAVWLYIRPKLKSPEVNEQTRSHLNFWTHPTAWAISVAFGIQSLVIYSVINFMPAALIEKGATAISAGNYSALLHTMCLVSSVAVSATFGKARNKPLYTVFVSLCYLLGVVGLWLGDLALTWLWIALFGIGSGVFIILLNLFVLRTETPLQAAQLSGMAQSVGYTLAVLGPLGAGVLFDWLGSWTASMGVLSGILVVDVLLAWFVAQPHKLTR